jgi:hypothetical protein
LNSNFPWARRWENGSFHAEFFIHPALNSARIRPGEPKRLEMLLRIGRSRSTVGANHVTSRWEWAGSARRVSGPTQNIRAVGPASYENRVKGARPEWPTGSAGSTHIQSLKSIAITGLALNITNFFPIARIHATRADGKRN